MSIDTIKRRQNPIYIEQDIDRNHHSVVQAEHTPDLANVSAGQHPCHDHGLQPPLDGGHIQHYAPLSVVDKVTNIVFRLLQTLRLGGIFNYPRTIRGGLKQKYKHQPGHQINTCQPLDLAGAQIRHTNPSPISKDQVRATLEQLIAAGLIEKTERGYRLPLPHNNGAATK